MIQRSFKRDASILTYLGVLPFLLCSASIIYGFEQQKTTFILLSYSAVIISFIAGIHWAFAMQQRDSSSIWLLMSSNIISLLAWCALLIPQPVSALVLLIFLLVALLMIDMTIYRSEKVEPWFIKLRTRVTVIVLLTLASAGVALV